MEFNGKKVLTWDDDFRLDKEHIGAYVDAEIVMDGMDSLPPVTMRLSCAQIGEAYTTRYDEQKERYRSTFHTYKCLQGNFMEGVWEYCGDCFAGENVMRGTESPYVKG